MKKQTNIVINDLTENDMYDIFYEAIEKLGVEAGDVIPNQMVDLRETVIRIMFKELDNKNGKSQ